MNASASGHKGGWRQELVPLFLNPGTGGVLRDAGAGRDLDAVVHEVPHGYPQFFLRVEPEGVLRLSGESLRRLEDIHGVVHVVRGLEGR